MHSMQISRLSKMPRIINEKHTISRPHLGPDSQQNWRNIKGCTSRAYPSLRPCLLWLFGCTSPFLLVSLSSLCAGTTHSTRFPLSFASWHIEAISPCCPLFLHTLVPFLSRACVLWPFGVALIHFRFIFCTFSGNSPHSHLPRADRVHCSFLCCRRRVEPSRQDVKMRREVICLFILFVFSSFLSCRPNSVVSVVLCGPSLLTLLVSIHFLSFCFHDLPFSLLSKPICRAFTRVSLVFPVHLPCLSLPSLSFLCLNIRN